MSSNTHPEQQWCHEESTLTLGLAAISQQTKGPAPTPGQLVKLFLFNTALAIKLLSSVGVVAQCHPIIMDVRNNEANRKSAGGCTGTVKPLLVSVFDRYSWTGHRRFIAGPFRAISKIFIICFCNFFLVFWYVWSLCFIKLHQKSFWLDLCHVSVWSHRIPLKISESGSLHSLGHTEDTATCCPRISHTIHST